MKRIEAFEFRIGWGSEKETTDKVNNKLEELSNMGIENITVNVTCTGKGVMYTLIYDVDELSRKEIKDDE